MPAVQIEPAVTLLRWRVSRVSFEDQRYDFLFGWDANNACGRCGTYVVSYDAAKRTATTKSGRLYQLKGESGFDPDALYVFESKFGTVPPNGVSVEDVSHEY